MELNTLFVTVKEPEQRAKRAEINVFFENLKLHDYFFSRIIISDVSDSCIHEDIKYLYDIFARKSKYVMAILLNFPLQSQLNLKQVTKLSKSVVKTIS